MARSILLCLSLLVAVTPNALAFRSPDVLGSASESPNPTQQLRFDPSTGEVLQGIGAETRVLAYIDVVRNGNHSILTITSALDGRTVHWLLRGVRDVRVDVETNEGSAVGPLVGGAITAVVILSGGGLIIAGIFGLFGGTTVILGTC